MGEVSGWGWGVAKGLFKWSLLKKATFPLIALDSAIWLWEFVGKCSLTIKFKQMINPFPSHLLGPTSEYQVRLSASEKEIGKVNQMNEIPPLLFLCYSDIVYPLKFSQLPFTVFLQSLAMHAFNHT